MTRLQNLTFIFIALTIIGYLSAPAFLGFTVVPASLAMTCAALAGFKQWLNTTRSLALPAGRAKLKLLAISVISLALLLGLGSEKLLPSFDFSRKQSLALAPTTNALLKKLDTPVNITINMGSQSPNFTWVQELMNHYVQEGRGLITVNYINPQTMAAANDNGPYLAKPNTAIIKAENFSQNISPINEDTVNQTLNKIMLPAHRLVYFLQTFGEKAIQDQGPGGLSQWAADMSQQRLTSLDYYWAEGSPLPFEASALVLVGPRAPLGELREEQLLKHLETGGKLMMLVDPLTVAISPEFWEKLGITIADGLIIDPEANLANTNETFVITRKYHQHPITEGLISPMLWPLVGAFSTAPKPTEQDNDDDKKLTATVFALTMSSPSAWLETDAASFNKGNTRYQADEDTVGPLVTAVAAEIKGGGRLVALADSDLASNNFRGFVGNQNFTLTAINWLLDGKSAILIKKDPGQHIIFSQISARLVFWLPTVAWPIFLLITWWSFYCWRRRLN